MKKFKKLLQSNNHIPTSSLPDIIFMLLFFFMVTTVVRPHELMVKQNLPEASQLRKIENRSLVTHFNVGAPLNETVYGDQPKLQSNDVFIELDQIPYQIENSRAKVSKEEKDQIIISMKIDGEVKMGLVNDIESQLKASNALKIVYNTFKEKENTF